MHTRSIARPSARALAVAIGLFLALAAPGAAWATQSMSGNFTGYQARGLGATDMLAVAMAQEYRSQQSLGYTEGWCADFVSDCAKIVGQSRAIPFNGIPAEVYKGAIAAGGKRVSTPRVGDLVFFNFDHVGIMIDAQNCISGNMGHPSKVKRCANAWVIPNAKIRYVRPAYTNWYRVAFAANGGQGKMKSQRIVRGKVKHLWQNRFTRPGYKFAGWNTKADGTGKVYKNKRKVKNLAKAGKAIRLYAQWRKL